MYEEVHEPREIADFLYELCASDEPASSDPGIVSCFPASVELPWERLFNQLQGLEHVAFEEFSRLPEASKKSFCRCLWLKSIWLRGVKKSVSR
jgi:hypothetical protein